MKTILGVIMFFSMLTFTTIHPAFAADSGHQNLDDSDLAIQGYDPVSYHAGKPLKGSGGTSMTYEGATYYFATEENLELFKSTPDRYVPAFGGWCAWAMLDGEKVEVDPKTYKVVNDRTYLFYNSFFVNTLTKWNDLSKKETESSLAEKAQSNWEALKGPSN